MDCQGSVWTAQARSGAWARAARAPRSCSRTPGRSGNFQKRDICSLLRNCFLFLSVNKEL